MFNPDRNKRRIVKNINQKEGRFYSIDEVEQLIPLKPDWEEFEKSRREDEE